MVGQRIRELRTQRGLSLSELAKRAQVAKSYLSSVEKEVHTNPSVQFLEKVARELGVPVKALLQDHNGGNEKLPERDTKLSGVIDLEWLELTLDAVEVGVSKDEFRQFLEFRKWQNRNQEVQQDIQNNSENIQKI